MDTAGKAVLFSGLTVFVSLSAVMLVPSPAFRSMALGIMLSVAFVLAATMTLLPAVLAKLGPRVDSLALRWVHSGEHRSRALRPLGRAALASPAPLRPCGDARPRAARAAGLRPEDGDAVDQGRAEERRLPHRLHAGAAGIRRRRPRRAPDRRPARRSRPVAAVASRDPGIAHVSQPQLGGSGLALIQATPNADPSSSASAGRSTGSAPRCPPARSSAAPPPRTTTSSRRSPRRRRS